MPRQHRCAVGHLSNLLAISAHGVVRLDAFQRQVGVPLNHCQQIVEVVRHAACQTPQCIHFLRLPKLFFQLFPLLLVPFQCVAHAFKRARHTRHFVSARGRQGIAEISFFQRAHAFHKRSQRLRKRMRNHINQHHSGQHHDHSQADEQMIQACDRHERIFIRFQHHKTQTWTRARQQFQRSGVEMSLAQLCFLRLAFALELLRELLLVHGCERTGHKVIAVPEDHLARQNPSQILRSRGINLAAHNHFTHRKAVHRRVFKESLHHHLISPSSIHPPTLVAVAAHQRLEAVVRDIGGKIRNPALQRGNFPFAVHQRKQIALFRLPRVLAHIADHRRVAVPHVRQRGQQVRLAA